MLEPRPGWAGLEWVLSHTCHVGSYLEHVTFWYPEVLVGCGMEKYVRQEDRAARRQLVPGLAPLSSSHRGLPFTEGAHAAEISTENSRHATKGSFTCQIPGALHKPESRCRSSQQAVRAQGHSEER